MGSPAENQSCDEIRSWSRAGEMVFEAECQSLASLTAKWVSLKSLGSLSCLQISGICLGSSGAATKQRTEPASPVLLDFTNSGDRCAANSWATSVSNFHFQNSFKTKLIFFFFKSTMFQQMENAAFQPALSKSAHIHLRCLD